MTENNETQTAVYEIEAQYLKSCLNTLFQVRTDALIRADAERWRLAESDPANVIGVNTVLEKQAFIEFADYIDNLEAGLDLQTIMNILKLADKDDVIRLEIKYHPDQDEGKQVGEKMILKFRDFVYKLTLLSTEMFGSKFEAPALDTKGYAIFSRNDFNALINAPYKIGAKYIYFELGDDAFKASSSSDAYGAEQEYNINRDYLIAFRKDDEGSMIKSLYSLEYLEQIRKALIGTKSNEIKLEFGNDYPLRATFNYAEDYGEAVFFLAPRIENYD